MISQHVLGLLCDPTVGPPSHYTHMREPVNLQGRDVVWGRAYNGQPLGQPPAAEQMQSWGTGA